MLESYIRTGDGKDYVDAACVKEALGIKEDENIFRAIEKLREDKDLLEELHSNHIDQLKDYAELGLELGIGSGDAESIKDYIASLKKERDELKEKCDKLKLRANALYGTSCGYSASKEPAFRCNVISYSWEFGSMLNSDSIRVELDLTPNANYKGTFDMEDLKKYIQAYGREKKLSDFEIFCKLVNNCIDELCDKYVVVKPDDSQTTRERLDYIFSVLAENRERYNSEWKRVEELKKEKRTIVDSLAELRAKIREIYRSIVDDKWDEHLSYTSALNDINEEYKRVVHNFEERTVDWSKAQQELDRYRLAVGSLLDIPKEARDDINAIERSFEFSKKMYMSLQEFRDNVCEIFDIPSSMADEQILKELHDIADRYYELRDFRADICEVLGIDADELFGSPQQNDQYILEQVEKLKGGNTKLDRYARLRSNICTALCLGGETSDAEILKAASEARKEWNNLIVFRNDVAKAVCSNPNDSNADILKAVEAVMEYATELQFNTVDKDNVVQPAHSKTTRYKSLQEFRDNVYKELGLPRYGCTLTEAIDELKKRLNRKDYTDLRKAIWEAMDRNPETLPEETARLVGEVTELARGEKLLIEFRDDVAKAIGMDYPTTNNFILKRVSDIYKERGESHDLAMELDRKCIDLTAKNSDLKQKFDFQSGLRRTWHARYESEHERANCVQKALDREREKCRVKDISLETAKKQYEKVCGNLETAECALNGMKSKVRSLQEEKTKVISALGQDIWDDCLK